MPKTFSPDNAQGENYQLVDNNTVLAYRFGDRTKPYDWQSRKRQAAGGGFPRPSDATLNDWALKQSSYGSKSADVQDNPFLSVATDYNILYANGEGWVQDIIRKTPDLAVFAVPFTTLYRPNPTKLISKQETEWLFYDGDTPITTYLREWRANPLRIVTAPRPASILAPSGTPFALHQNLKRRLASGPPANGAGPSSWRLGASGMTLNVSNGAVTDDVASAAYQLQLYGQGSALGRLQQAGRDVHDPAIYKSPDYYAYYIENLHALGLTIINASSNKLTARAYSGSFKVEELLIAMLPQQLASTTGAMLTKALAAVPATNDTALTDVMDFWWSSVPVAEEHSSLALSAVSAGAAGQASFTIGFYSFDSSLASWRSLFAESQLRCFDIYSYVITVAYDMELYTSQIYPAIAPLLAGHAATQIRTARFSA